MFDQSMTPTHTRALNLSPRIGIPQPHWVKRGPGLHNTPGKKEHWRLLATPNEFKATSLTRKLQEGCIQNYLLNLKKIKYKKQKNQKPTHSLIEKKPVSSESA